jgi:uncharacterized membrane protein YtjA (UPF0391 family)
MLRLALAFFIIAIIASLFSFGWISDMSYMAARICFFVFLVQAVLAVLGGLSRRPVV